ncbi:MAG: hypothetical protein WCK72_00155 [Actinomycetes bacterium]
MMRRPTTFQGLMVQAASGSYLLWAAGAAIPLIRIDFGISRTLASMHSISTGIGAVMGAHYAIRLSQKLTREILVRVMVFTMVIGILGLINGPSIWITVPSCGIAAFSQTIINAISLSEISHDDKPSLRRIFIQTGIQAGVGASAIFFISASLHANLGWRLPILIGILTLSPMALFMIWRVKFLEAPKVQSQKLELGTTRSTHYRIFTLGVLMSFVEMGVGFWSIDLLISRGAGVALGAFGSALLSIAICGFRLALAFTHLAVGQIMRMAVTLMFLGVGIICITNSSTVTMVGLVIAGAGSAALFSGGIFQISEGFQDAQIRISRYMMGTALSYGLTPFVLAIVFDNAGFIAGYLLLLPVLTTAFLMWRKMGAPQKHN